MSRQKQDTEITEPVIRVEREQVEIIVHGGATWSEQEWLPAIWDAINNAWGQTGQPWTEWTGNHQSQPRKSTSVWWEWKNGEVVVHMIGETEWTAWRWGEVGGLWTTQVLGWIRQGAWSQN